MNTEANTQIKELKEKVLKLRSNPNIKEEESWKDIAKLLYKNKFIFIDVDLIEIDWGRKIIFTAKEAGAPIAILIGEFSDLVSRNGWEKFFKIMQEIGISLAFYKSDFSACRFWAVVDISSPLYWAGSNIFEKKFVLAEYGWDTAKLLEEFKKFLQKHYK